MIVPRIASFLFGLTIGPLVVKSAKPVLRGAAKAVIGLGFEARKLAAQVSEEFQDIAAETMMEQAVDALPEPEPAAVSVSVPTR